MTRTRTGRALLTLLAGALLVLSTGADSSACSARGTSSGNRSATAPRRCSPSVDVFCWLGDAVYVEDHTGDRWPVAAYVAAWDRPLKLRVIYGPCRTGAGCAKVYDRNDGNDGDAGRTGIGAEGSDGVRSTTTYLNDYYADAVALAIGRAATARWVAEVVCHELGHVIGMRQHDDVDPASCVRTTVRADGNRTRVGAGDVAHVNARYR